MASLDTLINQKGNDQIERFSDLILFEFMKEYVEQSPAFSLKYTTALYNLYFSKPEDLAVKTKEILTEFERVLADKKDKKQFGTELAMMPLACAQDHLAEVSRISDPRLYLLLVYDVQSAEIITQMLETPITRYALDPQYLAAFANLQCELVKIPILFVVDLKKREAGKMN